MMVNLLPRANIIMVAHMHSEAQCHISVSMSQYVILLTKEATKRNKIPPTQNITEQTEEVGCERTHITGFGGCGYL